VKAIADKIRFIYIPFLLISAGFIVACSFLNWVRIDSGTLSISEEVTDFWLPFVLSWVPVFVWLRPRLRALKFKRSGSRLWFEFVAIVVIAIPTMIAQSYLETASGKLTKLDRVSRIQSFPATRYYLIKQFFADKSYALTRVSIRYGTRSRDPQSISKFFASPMRDSDDSAYGQGSAWLGIKYTATMYSRRDREAVEEETEKFAQSANSKFKDENLQSFSYFERIGNNDDRRSFEHAIYRNEQPPPDFPSGKLVILTGKHEPFASRNGNKLAWTLGVFGTGAALWFFMLLFPKMDNAERRPIPVS
jgi:hypothetical protein